MAAGGAVGGGDDEFAGAVVDAVLEIRQPVVVVLEVDREALGESQGFNGPGIMDIAPAELVLMPEFVVVGRIKLVEGAGMLRIRGVFRTGRIFILGGNIERLTGDIPVAAHGAEPDRKSTRLNSSHLGISYAV